MTVLGIGASSGIKYITLDQVARWPFGNIFVLFGLPKMIVVDADGKVSIMFKMTFQETLLIAAHIVARIK